MSLVCSLVAYIDSYGLFSVSHSLVTRVLHTPTLDFQSKKGGLLESCCGCFRSILGRMQSVIHRHQAYVSPLTRCMNFLLDRDCYVDINKGCYYFILFLSAHLTPQQKNSKTTSTLTYSHNLI